MNKIMIWNPILYNFEWEGTIEIEKMIDDLNAVKALGASHINMGVDTSMDSTEFWVEALTRREETDEEYEKREAKMNRVKEFTRKQELELLANLKLKYENN